MKNTRTLIEVILIIFITFSAIAFIKGTFNFMDWGEGVRTASILVSGTAIAIYFLIKSGSKIIQ